MGRWGKGIYDSDASLDYLSIATAFLMKDVAYLFAPEQVLLTTHWLTEVLTLVEMMLILTEEDHIGDSTHLMDQHEAARRWREVFFGVWDADWNETKDYEAPYGLSAYRIEQRQTAVLLFERLIEIADHWEKQTLRRDVPPFVLAGQLPLLSLSRFVHHRNGRHFSIMGRCLHTFIERMIEHIVLIFSEENREKEWGFDFYEFEEAWVAIDLIGVFCDKYQTTSGLSPRTVHRWLDITLALWIQYHSEEFKDPIDAQTLAEKDGMYPNVLAIYIRLITLAQRYPAGMPL